MDLPRITALQKVWRETPPPALALRKILTALGLKPAGQPDQKTGIIVGRNDPLGAMVTANKSGSI